MTKPTALRIAEELEATRPHSAAAELRRQHALIGELVKALEEAAQSLTTIAMNAGKLRDTDGHENYLQDHQQVRGYATSRAGAAAAVLISAKEQQS